MDDEFLHGSISSDTASVYRYEVFERDHHIQHQWWGGYTRHNRIWRKVINMETGEEREELVSENNAIMMYNPMLDK